MIRLSAELEKPKVYIEVYDDDRPDKAVDAAKKNAETLRRLLYWMDADNHCEARRAFPLPSD